MNVISRMLSSKVFHSTISCGGPDGNKTFYPTMWVLLKQQESFFYFCSSSKDTGCRTVGRPEGLTAGTGSSSWEPVSQSDNCRLQIGKIIYSGILTCHVWSHKPLFPSWHHLSNWLCLFSVKEMRSERTQARTGARHNGWAHKRFQTLQCWQITEENNHPTTI